jgi:hypothetical protein
MTPRLAGWSPGSARQTATGAGSCSSCPARLTAAASACRADGDNARARQTGGHRPDGEPAANSLPVRSRRWRAADTLTRRSGSADHRARPAAGGPSAGALGHRPDRPAGPGSRRRWTGGCGPAVPAIAGVLDDRAAATLLALPPALTPTRRWPAGRPASPVRLARATMSISAADVRQRGRSQVRVL